MSLATERTIARVINKADIPSAVYVYGEWFDNPRLHEQIRDTLKVIREEEPSTIARVQCRGLDSGDWHDWKNFK